MSLALSTARPNVRQLIRDVDASAYATKGYVLDQAISNNYQLIHARLRIPVEWQTLTALAVGDADYTLSGVSAKEFHTIGFFRLASNSHPVEKIGPSAMGELRAPGTNNGEPFAVALTEANPSVVGTTETTIQVFPTPVVVDTLEGLYATVATAVTAGGDLIELGQNGQRAVEYAAAAELLEAMPEKEAERLGIDRKVSRKYESQSRTFIEWEQVRISRLRTSRIANTSYKRP